MANTKTSSSWVTRGLIVGMVVPPILFLGSAPWLATLNRDLVFLVAGFASVSVLGSSLAMAIIKDRQSEEWVRTSARFSGHWGFVGGGTVLALLLALPPFQNWITSVAASLTSGESNDLHVIMAFTAGFLACVFLQMIAVLVIGAGWRVWMSRSS